VINRVFVLYSSCTMCDKQSIRHLICPSRASRTKKDAPMKWSCVGGVRGGLWAHGLPHLTRTLHDQVHNQLHKAVCTTLSLEVRGRYNSTIWTAPESSRIPRIITKWSEIKIMTYFLIHNTLWHTYTHTHKHTHTSPLICAGRTTNKSLFEWQRK
jgi:hypothetical protein